MIDSVEIKNRVFLAPMSGVSDLPFRRLAARFGAGAVVSEMVASEQLARAEDEAVLKATGEGISPHIVQLAGREAKWMEVGAKRARDAGAHVIDINMGCPAKKVTTGYSGSALMRDLDHAMTLVEATVNAVDCPVTLKMRLGWDDNSLNAADLALRAQHAGVKMVTVHGRTRCQFYKGCANWPAIAAVKKAISIPLVANGDVTSEQDAENILAVTGADGIMIGRGAYGRPWLVGHVAHYLKTGDILPEPTEDALVAIVTEHFEALLRHYGDYVGLRAARKHLSWYLDADHNRAAAVSGDDRLALLTATDAKSVSEMIALIFARPVEPVPSPVSERAA